MMQSTALTATTAAENGHSTAWLVELFESTFAASTNTVLLPHAEAWRTDFTGGNAVEPVYLPADDACPHNRIVFAHGFFASALHEIAHWCLAGPERRRKVDYGYWYQPDDRNAELQREFERVESKPQAIEWAFCIASGSRFQVSVDNLSGIDVDRAGFTRRVHEHLCRYARGGFPPRAQRFINTLCEAYGRRLEVPHLE